MLILHHCQQLLSLLGYYDFFFFGLNCILTRRFYVMGGCCHIYLAVICDLLYMTGRLIANIWYSYFGILDSVYCVLLFLGYECCRRLSFFFFVFHMAILSTIIFYQRSQRRWWLSQPPEYSSASLGGKYAKNIATRPGSPIFNPTQPSGTQKTRECVG